METGGGLGRGDGVRERRLPQGLQRGGRAIAVSAAAFKMAGGHALQ